MTINKENRIHSFASEYCCKHDSCLTMKSDPASMARMFGYTEQEMESLCRKGLLNLVEESERPLFWEKLHKQLAERQQAELMLHACRKDGTDIWAMNRCCLVTETDGEEYIYGVLVDLTWSKHKYDKEKEEEKILQEQIGKDSLTNLYNASTSRKMAEEYFRLSGPDRKCALLIIDLDDFKRINDHKGHMFGDAVLIQAAGAIRKLFRANDIVGRIGGDEFMVLMKDVSDREIVKKRCQCLNEILRNVFQDQSTNLMPTCSIGVGFSPEHGDSYFSLFCCADQALYSAKAAGKQQYVFYEEATCGPARGREIMEYAGYDRNILKGYLE